MEDILEIYSRPYNYYRPVVNMDEQPFQRLSDSREYWPLKPGQIEREDYEYRRHGTASIFIFVDALGNWRKVSVRERRTALDWAQEVKELLDVQYHDRDKVILICDNLNTHCIGSLYKAFPPDEAFRLSRRLEIHYTPKHGSWLNVAECELSVLTRQCLKKRIAELETLRKIAKKWETNRNSMQKGISWQFNIENSRAKLKSLYPIIHM